MAVPPRFRRRRHVVGAAVGVATAATANVAAFTRGHMFQSRVLSCSTVTRHASTDFGALELLSATQDSQSDSLQNVGRLNFGRRAASVVAAATVATSARTIATAAPRQAVSGDDVLVFYTGRLEGGSIFDTTQGKEPFAFKLGAGEVVPGFEAAVIGLQAGKKITVTVPPEKAYGNRDESLVFTVPASQVPKGLPQGAQVAVGGRPAVVKSIRDDGAAIIDANAPLAGKSLTFDIEFVGFREPPKRGVTMVGWQGKTLQVPIGLTDSPVSKVFNNPEWPTSWPYVPGDFQRQDETDDTDFYAEPRFVTHIDNDAIGAIRDFYALQFAQAPQDSYSVLDICSSWISHYPRDLRAKRVAITGMNERELVANKQATEHIARDLNKEPTLPFGSEEFDFVTNVVSVDYLAKPREIFKEMHRVLKPGGVAIMSFSNRCFATKAIRMWVADMSDGPGHCKIVGNYFHFNPDGGWRNISSVDITRNPGRSNPMWVVTAVKA